MGRALALREDFTAADLKRLARSSRDAGQTRRLLALAVIYDGGSRAEAAETGGVGRQIVRDWVERFNAEGPDGLVSRKPPGNPSKLTDAHRTELVRIVERGPIPATDGVVRWRLIDLAAWVWETFGISVSEATLSRALKALGYSKLSARPRHHARDTRNRSPLLKSFPRPPGGDPRCAPVRQGDRAVVRRVSDCVSGQAFCHGIPSRRMALRMLRSLRIAATRAALAGRPRPRRRR
jgi:transposase